MPDRDWGLPTALGIVLCIAVAWGLGVWNGTYNEARRADYDQSVAQPYSGPLPTDEFWKDRTGTSETYKAICAGPIDREQADLCQQWRSAQKAEEIAGYTLVSLIFGFVGLIGVALSVTFSMKATNAATTATIAAIRSADAAEKAYAAENRPWMDVTMTDCEIIDLTGDEIRVSFATKATNIGSKPAVARLFAGAYFTDGFFGSGITAVDNAIARQQQWSLGLEEMVFPAKEAAMKFSTDATSDSAAAAEHVRVQELNAGKVLPSNLTISVAFGVQYRGVGAENWQHTAYLAYLRRADGEPFVRGTKVTGDEIDGKIMSSMSRLT